MEGRCLEGHITHPSNTRMEETCRRQGIMEASSEGGQGPEGGCSVVGGMNGCLNGLGAGRRDCMGITGTSQTINCLSVFIFHTGARSVNHRLLQRRHTWMKNIYGVLCGLRVAVFEYFLL